MLLVMSLLESSGSNACTGVCIGCSLSDVGERNLQFFCKMVTLRYTMKRRDVSHMEQSMHIGVTLCCHGHSRVQLLRRSAECGNSICKGFFGRSRKSGHGSEDCGVRRLIASQNADQECRGANMFDILFSLVC